MVRKAKAVDSEEEKDLDTEEGADESSNDEENEGDVQPTKNSGISRVTFQVKNRNVPVGHSDRVFDAHTHGEGFLELANEFEATNTLKKPVNLQDAKEVEECILHNRNIHSAVLHRKDE